MEFSQDIITFLNKYFPGRDIDSMSLEELKKFRTEVAQVRDEYSLLELGTKTLANAAYGSCANQYFYFFNPSLAADITGECRNLTKTMWHNLEEFFHETLWQRKDLWEKFDFALDESKHDWYRKQPVSVYSDTDSVYTTYGNLFMAMTPEYQEKYKEDKDKLEWILKFNKDFLDGQNTEWCKEIYNPRHGDNVHVFELESVQKSQINILKKKYLKGYVFVKGKYYLDKPKVSGTGIELIKSTTPKLCREILADLMNSLMFEYNESYKDEYISFFNSKLAEWRKKFWDAPVEDISQSVGVGEYSKYVIDDKNNLVFASKAPISVKAVARFNYMAHKVNEDNKMFYSGKIKYYNICVSGGGTKNPVIDFFGYQAGELPSWAPPIDKKVQWQKTVVVPINRFLEVMNIPLVNADGTVQLDLFA